jgi:hypothetical protein
VFAIVSGELVGTGEFPSASLPGALVRFLARVRPQVGFQVRRFRVGLDASGERAQMSRHFLATPSLPPWNATTTIAKNVCSNTKFLIKFK